MRLPNALMLAALGCALLAGCQPDDPDANKREIHKCAASDGILPLRSIDEAIQTEGVQAARAIFGQCQNKLIAVYSGDADKLARDVGGQMDANKLRILGITEPELKGQHFLATDYVLTFSGKTLKITASKPGTRGYVSEEFQLR